MAIDVKNVTDVATEPGTLPPTMAAWVIRQEREGEPRDAFQIEEIEVPEPGALEVVVRVMAAGVNYTNAWAAMGKPVSVFRYHPEEDHHIGGSDASGIVWKTGPGVTKWQPGDEVIIHCNQASYEDPEVHGLDPLAAPSQKIWGYETSWGSFAQFTKVQAQQLIHKPKNLTWEDAQGRRVARRGEGALQGDARLRQGGPGDPRRRPEHRLRARRAGHVPHLGVRGQAVRQGRDLRRHDRLQPRLRRPLPVDAAEADHRLPLRQRLGVHQGQRADRLRRDPARA